MTVSSNTPKTRRVPIHPETGEIWTELQQELFELHCQSLDEQSPAAAARYRELHVGVEMRDHPYVCEFHLCLGAGAVTDPARIAEHESRHHYGCHLDTWAAMTDEARARFEFIDGDAFTRELNG